MAELKNLLTEPRDKSNKTFPDTDSNIPPVGSEVSVIAY